MRTTRRDVAATAPGTHWNWQLGLLAFSVCWGLFLGYYQVKFGMNVPPSTAGDEVDYDSIGWELAHGRGFSIDTGDPEFRKPYEIAARTENRFELGEPRSQVVTYRPPFFPYVICLLNRVLGRQFWGVRVVNAACMAGTLTLLVLALSWRFGWRAALLAIPLFIIVDVKTRLYGRAILTESSSLLLTSVLCCGLLRISEMQRTDLPRMCKWSGLLGVLFSVCLLTRSLLVLWVPGLVWMLYRTIRHEGLNRVQSTYVVVVFLVCGLAGSTPWAWRNMRVTGEFMPLGTQGQVQLAAAYGDEIWESRGKWVNLDEQHVFDEVTSAEGTRLQQEVAKAKWSRDKAITWIRHNPGKAIALFPMKVFRECQPQSILDAVLLGLACCGAFHLRKNRSGQILMGLILTNFFAIGLTWSVDAGRFLVPVLFPLHFLAAVGLDRGFSLMWVASSIAK